MRFLLSVAVKIVSSWIQQIAVHAGGWLLSKENPHGPLSRCPRVQEAIFLPHDSVITVGANLSVNTFSRHFIQTIPPKSWSWPKEALTALHFFPPKDNPFTFYHTLMMWICCYSLCLCPVSLIRAKTGDNWWFGTKIVIWNFLLGHNWGAETDAEPKYWRVHLLSLSVT